MIFYTCVFVQLIWTAGGYLHVLIVILKLCNTGALRGNIQNWFFKCNETLTRSNSFMTRKHVFNSLCDFPERFVECHSPDTIAAYDDGDLEAWEFEARRWARVLFMVLMDGEYLEEVFKVCLLNPLPPWTMHPTL